MSFDKPEEFKKNSISVVQVDEFRHNRSVLRKSTSFDKLVDIQQTLSDSTNSMSFKKVDELILTRLGSTNSMSFDYFVEFRQTR